MAMISLMAGALAGCQSGGGSGQTSMAPAAAPSVTLTAADLPGRWGLAAYRNEADLERTAAEARGACGNPYTIAAGPNGGAMMYLADQTTASELFVKSDAGGRVFIGPAGPPAVQQDRQVTSFENGVLVAEWLDPGVRERYGTMVFVRCGTA